MFKIGDVVVATPASDKPYNITTHRKNFIGKVVSIDRTSPADIEVETLGGRATIGKCYWVNSKYFKLKNDNLDKIRKLYGKID